MESKIIDIKYYFDKSNSPRSKIADLLKMRMEKDELTLLRERKELDKLYLRGEYNIDDDNDE
jgi:hypothetical protein